jgi:hypothetical protein
VPVLAFAAVSPATGHYPMLATARAWPLSPRATTLRATCLVTQKCHLIFYLNNNINTNHSYLLNEWECACLELA